MKRLNSALKRPCHFTFAKFSFQKKGFEAESVCIVFPSLNIYRLLVNKNCPISNLFTLLYKPVLNQAISLNK